MSNNTNTKTINDYSVTPAEGARAELKRRHRDPLTGDKVKGHKNRETDKRFTRRAAFVAMGTKALVELANSDQVEEPTLDADVDTFEIDGQRYAATWVNDTVVLHAV